MDWTVLLVARSEQELEAVVAFLDEHSIESRLGSQVVSAPPAPDRIDERWLLVTRSDVEIARAFLELYEEQHGPLQWVR